MVCKDCRELLSEYIDGALELGEQVAIERHLADCEPCRAVRDDLLQIVHFSHQLPLHSPAAALWPRIQADVRAVQPRLSRYLGWWTRIKTLNLSMSLPQFAAAAAALVMLVSVGVILSRTENGSLKTGADGANPQRGEVVPLSKTDLQQLEKQISQLSESVEQRKNSWDPELRTAFERNLYYVDQSLLECRHQLNENPADNVSQELMLNAYREKVRLLAGFEKF